MRAITLWPEWCWAILNLHKDCENRDWPLPPALVGQTVALHAGRSIGGRPGRIAGVEAWDGIATMARRSGWSVGRLGVMTLDRAGGVVRYSESEIARSSIVALVRFGAPVQDHLSGWAVPGAWHWPIQRLWPISPVISCPGAQGLWTVPADIETEIRRRFE